MHSFPSSRLLHIALSGHESGLKEVRLILWSQLGPKHRAASAPTHLSQPNSTVINNSPSITLCTQMGRQVEGWWRTAPCAALHPIIQIRDWTDSATPPHPPHPLSTFTLLPAAICILQVSFHTICHCRARAEDSFKKKKGGRGSFPLWFWVIYEVLCFFFLTVSLQEYQSLHTTVDRNVSRLWLSALYHWGVGGDTTWGISTVTSPVVYEAVFNLCTVTQANM